MYDLEVMKRLDLPDFVARNYGFVETDKSTQNARHLKNNADVIVCKPHPNGQWSWWSPDGERGDIISFVAWREKCKAYDAMTKIAQISAMPKLEFAQAYTPPRRIATPLPSPEAKFNPKPAQNWKTLRYSKYLRNRGIPDALLQSKRFLGSLAVDPRCNVIFPHYLDGKLCGYTRKNRTPDGKKITLFSKNGHKTVWVSRRFAKDNRLVVGEAGIDMLSKAIYDQRGDYSRYFHTRYLATDGGWNPDLTIAAIKREIQSMPQETVVVAAFDNDPAGLKYTEKLRAICTDLHRTMVEELPQQKDWNEQLQHDFAPEEQQGKVQDTKPTLPSF